MKRNGVMKRFTAALAAAVLAAAMLSGCANSTDYSITADGEKVNAGVYINYLLNEMSSQMYSMYYSQTITDPAEALTQDIEKDGEKKSFKTYCKDKALEYTKQFAAINAKFDELGLELTDEQLDEIKESLGSSWDENKEFMEYEGISKESMEQVSQISYKRDAIFAYYYEEGGIEEITEDDVQKYIEENYVRYKQITFSKSTSADGTSDAEGSDDIKAKAEEYLALAENVDYEGFDALIEQYQAEKEAEEAEESEEEAAEDAVTDTDSSADDSAAENSDSDAVTEVEGTVSQAEAAAETDTESEEVADTAADTDDTADVSADTEIGEDLSSEDSDETDSAADGEEIEEEEEPADYDTLVNFTKGTDTESETYDEQYATRLKEYKNAEYGKAVLYENDSAYYVYITADVAQKDGYAADNRDTLVHEMKDEDFEALINSWVEKMDIKVNSKAVKRYSVQEVYDRQEEYYSKND